MKVLQVSFHSHREQRALNMEKRRPHEEVCVRADGHVHASSPVQLS